MSLEDRIKKSISKENTFAKEHDDVVDRVIKPASISGLHDTFVTLGLAEPGSEVKNDSFYANINGNKVKLSYNDLSKMFVLTFNPTPVKDGKAYEFDCFKFESLSFTTELVLLKELLNYYEPVTRIKIN